MDFCTTLKHSGALRWCKMAFCADCIIFKISKIKRLTSWHDYRYIADNRINANLFSRWIVWRITKLFLRDNPLPYRRLENVS